MIAKDELLEKANSLALGCDERNIMIYDICAHAPDGAFVEFGVFKGGTLSIMLYWAIQQNREVHGYDTFGRFPPPGHYDKARDNKPRTLFLQPGVLTKLKGFEYLLSTSISDVKKGIDWVGLDSNYPVLHQGVFSYDSTLHFESCSVAHLDFDYYPGTYWAARKTWPLLVSGGTMMVHDYEDERFPGIQRAISDFLKLVPAAAYSYEIKHECIVLHKS